MTKMSMQCYNLCQVDCATENWFINSNLKILRPCGELVLAVIPILCLIVQNFYKSVLVCNNRRSNPRFNGHSIFRLLRIMTNIAILTILCVEMALILCYDYKYPQSNLMTVIFQTVCFIFNLLYILFSDSTPGYSDTTLHLINASIFILRIYDRLAAQEIEFYDKVVISGDSSIVLTYACYLMSSIIDKPRILTSSRENLVEIPDIQLQNGHQSANLISKFLFYWSSRLMVKGSRGQLNSLEDLFQLPNSIKVEYLSERMRECFNLDMKYGNSLFKILNACFGREYYFLGILKLLSDILNFAGPLLLGFIVNFVQNNENSTSNSQNLYIYAASLFGATFISSICSMHFSFRSTLTSLKLRAALISSIYEKLLTVQKAELCSKFSTGEITNFVSTDVNRIVNFVPSFHSFWSLPMQICIALYMLYREVHIAFLTGVAFTVLLIPLNRMIAQKIGQLSTKMMSHKDGRLKCLSEMLHGIRVVKFCAWENFFSRKVDDFRCRELQALKGRKYLDALCVYLWASAPAIVAILTFSTYIFMGFKLTAAKVFTSLALFNILITPLNAFPWVISGLVEAWISLKRLQLFFDSPQFDEKSYFRPGIEDDGDCEIHINNGEFSWSRDGSRKLFINTIIPKGRLVGIKGVVGSGKTTLIESLLGEMISLTSSPSIRFDRFSSGVAIVTQEPWLQRGTIRENILFGSRFDPDWYEKVLWACALTADLKLMPLGDMTSVGEQGVMLSGGQKIRIALARAVYQNLNVYLLDDPLSAVDAKVAKFLFENCIRGILKSKTVLLVTHHTRFLREADQILLMEDLRLKSFESPNEIFQVADSELGISDVNINLSAEEYNEDADQNTLNEPIFEVGEEKETGFVKSRVYFRYLTAIGTVISSIIFLSLALMQGSKNMADLWLSYWLTQQNSSNVTLCSHCMENTSSAIYQHSIRTAALIDQFYSKSVQTLVHGYYTASNLISSSGDDSAQTMFYLKIYAFIILSNTFFTLIRSFSFAYGGLKAAKKLHSMLLQRILKAPCQFFDATPLGRIINRFSADIWCIDDSLPFQANIFVMFVFAIMGTIAMTCYGLPWFVAAVVPIVFIYYRIQKYYRRTTCELKRLNTISLSPIFGQFSNTLNGLTIIKAFKQSGTFVDKFHSILTGNQMAEYSLLACSMWLNVRIQAIGIFMIICVVVIVVVEHEYRSVDAGLVGLAISYALSVTGIFNGLLTSFTETEKELISVERVSDYIENVPQEKDEHTIEPPKTWPNGGIVFCDVNLRYVESAPLALRNLSFEIFAGEKIGIVGRTGSGKSSIFQALFRTTKLESGSVSVDNIDISTVSFQSLSVVCNLAKTDVYLRSAMRNHHLISRLCIIPQSPFLFSGSLRDNLTIGLDRSATIVDGISAVHQNSYTTTLPGFNTDARLEWVLEKCSLEPVVRKLVNGLDGLVGERGQSLSVGERQLVCLARALLIGSKIVCIDEATAHVDLETDARIQKAIKEGFPRATVLTIAHRLNTVMDYDRIMVMDGGRLVEFDTPKNLLNNQSSCFSNLVSISSSRM